jgi:IS5 family transposase
MWRIGEKGVGLVLQESIELHRDQVEAEDELVADTTVHEANVTYPTETKLRERVILRLWRLGEKKGLKWARSHKRTVPKLLRTARSRSNRQAKARRKAINKLRKKGQSLLRQ